MKKKVKVIKTKKRASPKVVHALDITAKLGKFRKLMMKYMKALDAVMLTFSGDEYTEYQEGVAKQQEEEGG